jgi:methyltransferase (TIGR00027 family)
VTAYCRALSAHDEREGLRGPDYMAEIFLKERGGTSLRDQPSREWAITRLLSPGLYAYLYARTAWFDAVFAEELRSDVRQIVLVGAGYDSRAYRFRDMLRDTRIFEVDVPTTQERKRSILEEAKVAIPDQVRFVPVNFKTDTLDQVLPNHGFDTAARTLFIWEGVMYYLEAESVDRVLEFVVRSSGHASCLCFDYMNQAIPSTRAAEPFQFWVSSDELEPYLAKRGLRLAGHLTPHDIDKTFLTLPDGTPTGHTRPFFCFARAEVAS